MEIKHQLKKPAAIFIALSALLAFGWALVFVGWTVFNGVFDDHGPQYGEPEQMPQVQNGDYENYQKV